MKKLSVEEENALADKHGDCDHDKDLLDGDKCADCGAAPVCQFCRGFPVGDACYHDD